MKIVHQNVEYLLYLCVRFSKLMNISPYISEIVNFKQIDCVSARIQNIIQGVLLNAERVVNMPALLLLT